MEPRRADADGALAGRVFVAGGIGRFGTTGAFEVYNPKTDHWRAIADIPAARPCRRRGSSPSIGFSMPPAIAGRRCPIRRPHATDLIPFPSMAGGTSSAAGRALAPAPSSPLPMSSKFTRRETDKGLREAGAGGSKPPTPTNIINNLQACHLFLLEKTGQ